jgi:hypothetical protein
MDEIDRWIYLDGPEPEPVGALLDTFRDLPPATPEDMARMSRAFFVRLDAKLRGVPPGPPAEQVRDDAPAVPPPAPRVRPIKLAPPDPEDAEPGRIAEPPPPAPAPPAFAAPPSAGAPSALATTSPTLDLPPLEDRGKMPFKDPRDVLPPPRVAKTDRLPVWRPPGLGETAPLDDDRMARARAQAVLPFVPSAADLAVTVGGVTVVAYASFRAELAVWPEEGSAILTKYRVPTYARAALDDQWQQHLARNLGMRVFFSAKLEAFTMWLADKRAQGHPRPL